jgi:hypothetical protein
MQFDFFIDIEKAESNEGKLFLEGVASTVDTDLQNETVSNLAIERMAKSAIGIPVVINSHNHEFTDEIGSIVSAKAESGRLHIRAELDGEDPIAVRTFKKVQKSKKVGFSIGGKGKGRYLGKSRVIDEVFLSHVMLTSKPANPNTFAFAIAKALTDEVIVSQPEDTMTLEEMLKSDEMQAHITGEIAKAKTEAEVTIAKAGATFSAANKTALKDIHDAGDDLIKQKVRAALGADADDVLGESIMDGDDDDNTSLVGEGIGVEKSLDDKLDDFRKSVIAEIKDAVSGLTTVVSKGSANPDAPVVDASLHNTNETLGESLRRMLL